MSRRQPANQIFKLWPLLFLVVACGRDAPSEPALLELPAPETVTWIEQPVSFSPPPDWNPGPWKQAGLTGVIYTRSGSPPGLIAITQYHLLRRQHSRTTAGTGKTRTFEPAPNRFDIHDVVDRVRFQTEDLSQFGRVEIQGETETLVAGRPAIQLDYTFESDRGSSLGRELYVVAEQELFALKARGRQEDLDLFERIVETVTFPSGASDR